MSIIIVNNNVQFDAISAYLYDLKGWSCWNEIVNCSSAIYFERKRIRLSFIYKIVTNFGLFGTFVADCKVTGGEPHKIYTLIVPITGDTEDSNTDNKDTLFKYENYQMLQGKQEPGLHDNQRTPQKEKDTV